MKIAQATIADIDRLVPLFDSYRRFYGQSADLDGARAFLTDRFRHQQSIIFLAQDAGEGLGFTQLYPGFSSVSMARIFILNDLFVAPQARSRGTGRALLDAACAYGRAVGAVRLSLSTAVDNLPAQALYERAGWVRDTRYLSYDIALT